MKSNLAVFPRSAPQEPSAAFVARLERVHFAGPAEEPALKAERIQELLSAFPGWQICPGGPGLVRGYRFPSHGDATAFAVFVAGVLERAKVTPELTLVGPLAAIHVASLKNPGEVSALDFDLVALLEGREE